MTLFSQILASVLNSKEKQPFQVEHLIERWEIVLCGAGQERGRWILRDDAFYVESLSMWAHVNDTFSCDGCSACELINDSREVFCFTMRGSRFSATWCENCYQNNSMCCSNCNDNFHEDFINSDDNGDYYCNDCYTDIEDNNNEENDDELPSYHSAYRPLSPFCLNSERVYSVELEIESPHRSSFLCELKAKNLERVIWESDGSLDCQKGVEVIICFQKDIQRLKEILFDVSSIAKKHHSTSWNNKRCGCHVNSNKGEVWSTSASMRLLWLVRSLEIPLKRISGREGDCHYASWQHPPRLKAWAEGYCTKYTALRVGFDRFEWRMFRGTLNKTRLALYLDVVRLLEDEALTNSIHSIKKRFDEISQNVYSLINTANNTIKL